MKTKIVNILKIIVFTAVLLFMLKLSSNVFFPNSWGGEDALARFYELKKDSVDMVFLGASSVFVNINSPLEFYKRNGITAYFLTSGNQSVFLSYYLLKSAFLTQSPKIIFLDIGNMRDKGIVNEPCNNVAISKMPFSKEKIMASWINSSYFSNRLVKFMLPFCDFYSYHNSWKSLNNSYFARPKAWKRYNFGWYPHVFKNNIESAALGNLNNSYYEKLRYDKTLASKIPQENLEYLKKIKEVCEDHNAKLVLIKTPNCFSWNKDLHEKTKEIAVSLDVPYLDMNYDNDIGLVYEDDYSFDRAHINPLGGAKVVNFLGKYIEENYDIPPRVDEEYAEYVPFYEKQIGYINSVLLNQDMISYLDWLNKNKDHLEICIAAKDEAMLDVNSEIQDKLYALGLQTEFVPQKHHNSYIGVIDQGNVLYDKAEKLKQDWTNNEKDKSIEISSSGYYDGNYASIKINNVNYAVNSRGLNIVVYDYESKKVIDSVCFDTCNYQMEKKYNCARNQDATRNRFWAYSEYLYSSIK